MTPPTSYKTYSKLLRRYWFLYCCAADSTVTIAGGTGITTAVSGSTLTITNTVALPSAQEGQTLVRGSSFEAVASPVLSYEFSASNNSNAYHCNGWWCICKSDPTLYVYRGFTYRFDNTTGSGHPLALRVSAGGSAISGTTGSLKFCSILDSSYGSCCWYNICVSVHYSWKHAR